MMRKGEMKKQKGFTVIETALVIAIAGLIFLMVFVALPGLRAQQRDTDRRTAVTIVIDNIKDYQTNNRGSLPKDWGVFRDEYLGGDDFMDPNGMEYALVNIQCSADGIDKDCKDNQLTNDLAKSNFPNSYRMYIVMGANCSGEKAIKSSNPRKVAVLYRLESAGVYCQNS